MFNSLTISIGIFLIAAFIIAVVGAKMTKIADRLADKTGLGEAVVGAFLLFILTSVQTRNFASVLLTLTPHEVSCYFRELILIDRGSVF